MVVKFIISDQYFTYIDDEDYKIIKNYKWYITKSNGLEYAITRSCGSTVKMHRLILQVFDRSIHVDHINHNTLDNRKCNLRSCNIGDNCRNQRICKLNTSGYKGVHKSKNKWRAVIGHNSKHLHIGYFKSKEDAAKAYDEKAKELYGEFAYLNFPDTSNHNCVPKIDKSGIIIKHQRRLSTRNSTGYIGIIHASKNSWQSIIMIKKKCNYLGSYKTAIMAAFVYDENIKKYNTSGKYKLNFPHYTESCNIDPSIINDIHIIPSST